MDFDESIVQLINRRRRQILVHSFIIYFYSPIIDSKKFDEWAYELASLQITYPDLANRCIYAQEFNKDFDSRTGFLLPLDDPWIEYRARMLMDGYERHGD